MKSSVLLVDDNLDFAETMAAALATHGYHATACESARSCMAKLAATQTDVVVVDFNMPDTPGVELVKQIREKYPDVMVMMVTGQSDMRTAIAAMQAGACDYVTKPVTIETLAAAVARAREHVRLSRECRRLQREPRSEPRFGIAGSGPQTQHLIAMIERVGASDASVLITGESGTGKELVARAIHELSRPYEPFVAINCAAMPENLLESELFGHAAGAFTDARTTRDGLFVTARGGTILLDEIGEMPLPMQVKLLRVLQERRVRPIGATTELPVRARVLTATNRNLDTEVAERRFREDLYYRINVMQIAVPPLRERAGDVLSLAQRFLERAARRSGKDVRGISPWAARKLLDYSWPGNVRELENCMERAVALCRLDQITVDDLPHKLTDQNTDDSAPDLENLVTLDKALGRHVRRVLDSTHGNKTRAASILGIDRRSLYRRLEYAETAERDRREDSHDDSGGTSIAE